MATLNGRTIRVHKLSNSDRVLYPALAKACEVQHNTLTVDREHEIYKKSFYVKNSNGEIVGRIYRSQFMLISYVCTGGFGIAVAIQTARTNFLQATAKGKCKRIIKKYSLSAEKPYSIEKKYDQDGNVKSMVIMGIWANNIAPLAGCVRA